MRRAVSAAAHAWNWKAAMVSSLCRALIFFAANLSEGRDAALRAMYTELAYRALASGFYGSLTQAFTRLPPGPRTTFAALVAVPGLAHAVEFGVHSLAGTPALGVSMAGSIAFSMITTLFNLHAMRSGALIVGEGSRPLIEDFRRMSALAASFAASAASALRGCLR